MKEQYIIIYRNHPKFKGVDAYAAGGTGRVGRMEYASVFTMDQAKAHLKEWPSIGVGHLDGEIIPHNTGGAKEQYTVYEMIETEVITGSSFGAFQSKRIITAPSFVGSFDNEILARAEIDTRPKGRVYTIQKEYVNA